MPSKSKAQQKFFAMVKKCKDTGYCPSKSIEKTAKSMSKKDISDYASTSPEGLPDKVLSNEELMKEIIRNVVNEREKPDNGAPNHAHYASVMSDIYDLETDFHYARNMFHDEQARIEGKAIEKLIIRVGEIVDKYFEKYMDDIDLN